MNKHEVVFQVYCIMPVFGSLFFPLISIKQPHIKNDPQKLSITSENRKLALCLKPPFRVFLLRVLDVLNEPANGKKQHKIIFQNIFVFCSISCLEK